MVSRVGRGPRGLPGTPNFIPFGAVLRPAAL